MELSSSFIKLLPKLQLLMYIIVIAQGQYVGPSYNIQQPGYQSQSTTVTKNNGFGGQTTQSQSTSQGQYVGSSNDVQQPGYQSQSTTVTKNGFGGQTSQSQSTTVTRTSGPMGQQTTVVRTNSNPQYTQPYGAGIQNPNQGGIYRKK